MMATSRFIWSAALLVISALMHRGGGVIKMSRVVAREGRCQCRMGL